MITGFIKEKTQTCTNINILVDIDAAKELLLFCKGTDFLLQKKAKASKEALRLIVETIREVF